MIADCHRLGPSSPSTISAPATVAHLPRIARQHLKIDRVFVRDMLWDSGDLAIVRGVIGMSGAFRRTCRRRGRRHLEHADLLLRLAATSSRGLRYRFQPMPADQLAPGSPPGNPGGLVRPRQIPPSRDELQLIGAEVGLRQWTRSLEAAAAMVKPATCRPSKATASPSGSTTRAKAATAMPAPSLPSSPCIAELATLGKRIQAPAGGAHHRLGAWSPGPASCSTT